LREIVNGRKWRIEWDGGAKDGVLHAWPPMGRHMGTYTDHIPATPRIEKREIGGATCRKVGAGACASSPGGFSPLDPL
jgi:hypothetical protein